MLHADRVRAWQCLQKSKALSDAQHMSIKKLLESESVPKLRELAGRYGVATKGLTTQNKLPVVEILLTRARQQRWRAETLSCSLVSQSRCPLLVERFLRNFSADEISQSPRTWPLVEDLDAAPTPLAAVTSENGAYTFTVRAARVKPFPPPRSRRWPLGTNSCWVRDCISRPGA